ncbi:MAG: sodium-dependent transporter [Puniceicoccales bacterium]|jgi:SNF family Na+-dependent transporter|nr:sodium-dependent transporter [Puniceicoccales bacterium]
MEQHSHHDKWNSRLGVILAVAGSAVGLGNFLRFPGLAAQYGGAAFLVAYCVSLLLIGVPVSWAEWTVGRLGGRRGYHSSPGILHALTGHRWAKYLGAIGVLVPLSVCMYYVYIEAWCLGYAFNALSGGLAEAGAKDGYAAFFNSFTGATGDGDAFIFTTGGVGLFVLVVLAVNLFLIYRGISRGIEKVCRYGMPLLMLLAVVLVVRVLTLPPPDAAAHPERTISAALGFLWNPSNDTLARLANPQLWLAAGGQVFFSLTVGMGAIITYASYLRKTDDVALSSLTAVSTNEFCEVVLGAMLTVPAAFLFLGGDALAAGQGSFSLGFKVLPAVFQNLPAGAAFATAFFALLALAALTSSISLLQPVLAFLEEAFHLRRAPALTALAALMTAGTAWAWYFSKDLKALDTMDFWAGSVGVFVLGTIVITVFGWALGPVKGWRELRRGAEIRPPEIFRYIMRYATPLYLLTIFALFIAANVVGWNFRFGAAAAFAPTGYVTDLIGGTDPATGAAIPPNTAARATAGFLAALSVLIVGLIFASRRRWKRRRVWANAAEAAANAREERPATSALSAQLETPAPIALLAALPVLAAAQETGLTAGGWLTMLTAISAVTAFFVWCLTRVLRKK